MQNDLEYKCNHGNKLKEIYKQINETKFGANQVIDLLHGHKQNSRSRRSLLPFVGRISRFLFGTVDEKTERELKNLIQINMNNTSELANLLAKQTEIVNTEFDTTRARIEFLRTTLEQTTLTAKGNDLAIKFSSAVTALAESVLQFELDTNILTDAILFGSRGTIHPRFISPNIIEKSALTVEKTVSIASFPNLNESTSILEILKIADLSIFFANHTLVYYISIPLLDEQEFNLHKISPLPIEQNNLNSSNTFSESHFVAVSLNKRNYMPITLDKINQCRKLQNHLICKETEPIRDISEFSACEIRFIVGRKVDDLRSCNLKIIKLRETFWLRLHETNSWTFSTVDEENILIWCRGVKQTNIKVNRAGILKMTPGCSAHTNNARILASREIEIVTNKTLSLGTKVDLKEILDNIRDNINMSIVVPEILNKQAIQAHKSTEVDQLSPLKNGPSLQEIIERARRISETRYMQSKFATFQKEITIYGGSLASLSLVGLLVWKIFFKGGPLATNICRMFSGNVDDQERTRDQGAIVNAPQPIFPLQLITLPHTQVDQRSSLPMLPFNNWNYGCNSQPLRRDS